MASTAFQKNALSGLCTSDRRKLLASIDILRSQGIDHAVPLPQIIVCGAQSSGKSSVLKAISSVPFPIKSNLPIQFPVELVLRRTSHTSIHVSFVPDQSRSETERSSLASFSKTLDNFDELPWLIGAAGAAMQGKSFAKDLLRVEISGPDQPHLTIVDLPGLMHSSTGQQSASEIELVRDVVETYMKDPRSIILAVISAKDDHTNQSILSLARAVDQAGTRTLGVITKPDNLVPDSETERSFVAIAKNQDVRFPLGWHMLKNTDTDKTESSWAARDAEEAEFFAQGVWQELPRSILGVRNLRNRLCEVLDSQTAAELPSLIAEIESKSETCRHQLKELEEPRATFDEQRAYLLQISQQFQSLIKESTDGTYSDPFFEDAKSETGYKKRMRATVQNLSTEFAESMTKRGHYCQIVESGSDTAVVPKGIVAITRADYIERVQKLASRSRGRELQSLFNPMIVADLFKEQSGPWKGITGHYTRSAWDAACELVRLTASHVTDSETSKLLFNEVFHPALNALLEDLNSKTAEVLALHRSSHPTTYNQEFVTALQAAREHRSEQRHIEIIKSFFDIDALENFKLFGEHDLRPLAKALAHYSNSGVDYLACSDALDCMEAYYKVALKRFIDDVAIYVIEAKLFSHLGGIFSPKTVLSMTPEQVKKVTGGSEERLLARERWNKRQEIFLQGLEACKEFVDMRESCQSTDTKLPPLQISSLDAKHDAVGTAKSDDTASEKSSVLVSDEAASSDSELELVESMEVPESGPQQNEVPEEVEIPEVPQEGKVPEGVPQKEYIPEGALEKDEIPEDVPEKDDVPNGIPTENKILEVPTKEETLREADAPEEENVPDEEKAPEEEEAPEEEKNEDASEEEKAAGEEDFPGENDTPDEEKDDPSEKNERSEEEKTPEEENKDDISDEEKDPEGDKDEGSEKDENPEEEKTPEEEKKQDTPEEEKVPQKDEGAEEHEHMGEGKTPEEVPAQDAVTQSGREPGFWGEWVITKKERAARRARKAQQKQLMEQQ